VAKPRTRRIRLGSLIFLAVVAVAGAGGWYAYKAIDRAINGTGSSGGSHPARVKRQPARSAPARTRTAAPVARRPVTAPGCPAIGPVRLVDIYASEIAPVAGNPVTFNYTIVNDAPQCHSVALGLAFYRAGQPGAPLTTPPGSSLTAAQPGSHVYQRQFTFPTSAAGQRFDVEWRVTDPSGARTYDTKRVAGLITVSAR
jgi:hypothetical protein